MKKPTKVYLILSNQALTERMICFTIPYHKNPHTKPIKINHQAQLYINLI
jgi:hypothetical protein